MSNPSEIAGSELPADEERPAKRVRQEEKRPPKNWMQNEVTGLRNQLPFYASRVCETAIEQDTIPKVGFPARYCLREVEDRHELDFSQNLNTSSYVNVVAEPEEEEVALMGLKVNLADQTVYPSSFQMHNHCVACIANLWNCPKPKNFETTKTYAGAGTVGSTEACLLAGLALKFRWRRWYAKTFNKSEKEVLSVQPNIIISTLYQAAWEVGKPQNTIFVFLLKILFGLEIVQVLRCCSKICVAFIQKHEN